MNWLNVRCQKSIRLNFCRSVTPEFLRSLLYNTTNIDEQWTHILWMGTIIANAVQCQQRFIGICKYILGLQKGGRGRGLKLVKKMSQCLHFFGLFCTVDIWPWQWDQKLFSCFCLIRVSRGGRETDGWWVRCSSRLIRWKIPGSWSSASHSKARPSILVGPTPMFHWSVC